MIKELHFKRTYEISKSNVSMHTAGILRDKELKKDTVVQNYLTTAADEKNIRLSNGVAYYNPTYIELR